MIKMLLFSTKPPPSTVQPVQSRQAGLKVKRRDQGLAQIESDAELAQRLHEEELAELERAQKERQKQEEATSAALAEDFDEIQARIDADHELAVRLTHEEQEKYTIEERARLLEEFFKRRKKQLAAERDKSNAGGKTLKKRPMADSEDRKFHETKLEEDIDAEKEELRIVWMWENRKWHLKALEDGPYVFRNITPIGSIIPRLQEVEYLQGDDLLYYDAEMELMNMILLSIPNEIYNSVDSCKMANEMWDRVERLMRGTIQNQVDRETRFTNEFDQFVAEPGESLVLVYNRFAQLMNDLERNNMKFPTISVNIMFLNSLQPEWLKYKLVNASREKKLEKSHDPLALVAHTGSSSRNTTSYYVTHPSYVVDYNEEYEQDDVHNHFEDPLASAMLLLAKAITQNFSNPTINRLRASSNTRNQTVVQGDRVNIQSRNSGNVGRNNRRAYV
ncbi:hypothetical protein Tco_0638475 [Tanacetum coccineum]